MPHQSTILPIRQNTVGDVFAGDLTPVPTQTAGYELSARLKTQRSK